MLSTNGVNRRQIQKDRMKIELIKGWLKPKTVIFVNYWRSRTQFRLIYIPKGTFIVADKVTASKTSNCCRNAVRLKGNQFLSFYQFFSLEATLTILYSDLPSRNALLLRNML